jgi:large-conductance mechanosensitive channel
MKTGVALKSAEIAPSMAVEACSKIVEAATNSCTAPATLATPNWDAMATSFASLSNAFAWGSLIVAIMAFIMALAWGKIVTARAEKEARDEAKKCANELIAKWLAEEAPQIIRLNVEIITNATLGNGNDEKAADDIGKEAG